ncbi:MAG: hypothetical protein KGI67_05070 [Pseudomonadota bacterium]|nr:hypothetical protein [Pseudomonadota bacterium]
MSPRQRGGEAQRARGLVDTGQRSLAELLPWLCLHGPQRVLCKEGSLLACFEMIGLDADSLDVDEANRVSARVELALRGLDERITLWSIFQRRRSHAYPRASFAHPVARRIDALHGARFRAGQQFVNSHVLALLFSPDSQTRAWDGLLGLLRRRARPAAATRAPTQPGRAWPWSGALDGEARAERAWSDLATQARTFEALLEAFVAALHGLGVRRLAGAELLGFLNTCASPTRAPGPVRPPGSALFLDAALGEDSLRVGAEQLRFAGSAGSRVVAALGIKAWPEATVPGLIESLLRVPQQLSVVQVFRVADGDSAKRHIQAVQRFHLNLRRSAFSFLREAVLGEAGEVVDDTRAMAAAEAREALAALGSQRQVYGWFNLSVLVSVAPGEDLDAALRACAVAVREAGFLVMREGLHLLSAWTGALPGQWGQLVRWHFIHNGNVADLMPLQMPGLGGRMNSWLGEQLGAPCTALTCLPGLDRTTFHFNFHHGDLGHCLLLGPSRAGKSMLANFLLSQFQRYPRARILIFDKDRSCRIPTLLQGGVWLDPSAAGGPACNPVAAISQPGGRAWLHAWLRELLTLHGRAWGADDEAALASALEALAILPLAQHRLATLQPLLPAALAAELAPWVGEGVHAQLFDSASDGLALGALCCIEMGELLRDPALARLFMAHAVRRIDALLAEVPLAPTVIYVEEAWFMLAEPGFRERLRDWLKTLPKRLALVLMATQSLEDLTASPVFQSLADNVPTRIFLANRNAPQQAALYQGQFGLNPAQLQRIACAEPKRQFLVVRPGQSRFIDLPMPAETVQLLRSDRRAQAVFDRVLAAQCAAPCGLDGLATAYLEALERDDARA